MHPSLEAGRHRERALQHRLDRCLLYRMYEPHYPRHPLTLSSLRYSVFEERPLQDDIVAYCCADVLYFEHLARSSMIPFLPSTRIECRRSLTFTCLIALSPNPPRVVNQGPRLQVGHLSHGEEGSTGRSVHENISRPLWGPIFQYHVGKCM